MILDYGEIYRYLGYGIHRAGSAVEALVHAAVEELELEASPKHVLRAFAIEELTPSHAVVGGVRLESRDLASRLKGCDEVAVLAATLGISVDRLIESYERRGIMSRALVMQAVAVTMIEAYCDRIQEGLAAREGERARRITDRFSPGYGDLGLAWQRDVLRLLNAHKAIGLTLTDGLMLVPLKSVTALIGIGCACVERAPSGCAACLKDDCPYRKTTGER